jgi:hypothetical protein
MIKLIPDADAKIKKLIFENSVRAYYFSTCEHYAKGYVNTFITNMQILITKLGIMVSKISNGPNIAYCHTSINYLCSTVLDNPALIKTFDDIGLNDKGNHNKHTIAQNVNIDMLRCVTTYNNLVTRIADKYGLRSLEHMIVRKAHVNQTSNDIRKNNNTKAKSNKPTPVQHKTGRPAESQATADGNLKVRATLERGEGRYTKGIFNKKGMVNFKLRISIENQEDLKIASISALLKGKGDQLEKKLSTSLESTTEFDLPTDTYGGQIEASVVVIYKIGLFKSKQIKVTVSKNF